MDAEYEQIISIEDIRMEAYVGVYPIEKQEKNKFSIDIFIKMKIIQVDLIDELSETLDYQKVYDIVIQEMEMPGNLLETKANSICTKIQKIYNNIYAIKLKIRKLNPMYMKKCACAAVEITKMIPFSQ